MPAASGAHGGANGILLDAGAESNMESAEKYRSIFDAMRQGYIEADLLRDAHGHVFDFRILEANPQYERLTGIPREQAIGRRIRELFPDLESAWFETFERIVRLGEPEIFEREVASSGRWYEVHAYPLGPERFAALFDEITARKQAEAALRDSEEQNQYLLKLSDALRPLADPARVQGEAMRVLAQHLGITRAHYYEADGRAEYLTSVGGYSELPRPVAQRIRMDDFGAYVKQAFRAGHTLAVSDVASDPRVGSRELEAYDALGFRAFVGIPLIKGGCFVGGIGLHHSAPRQWSDSDLAIAQATAERTWEALERARAEAALARSETQYRSLFEMMGQAYQDNEMIRDAHGRAIDYRLLAVNPRNEELTGVPADRAVGHTARELVPGLEMAWIEKMDEVVRTGAPARFEQEAGPLGRWYEVYAYPRGDDRFAVLFDDITPRKQAQAALSERVAWLSGQKDAFQAAVDGASLEASLGVLCRTAVEQEDGQLRCAFYMADAEGTRIQHVTGTDESRCVDGFRIGPDSLACGLAIHTGKPVITADVLEDDAWRPWRALAERHDYRAAWSFPVETSAGKVIGSFAMYFRTPRQANARDHELAGVITRAAAIIIAQHQADEERERAEMALRESEERLRQFGDASHDVIWIRDARSLQWNYLTPAFEAIYGVDREQAMRGNNYRSWLQLVVPEDRHEVNRHVRKVRAGEHVTFDFRVRRPCDGGIRWLRNTDFPITDERGGVVMIGGIGHDMTELRETEFRLTTLLEGIPQLVWRADDRGHWTWASPQWTEYTGQGEEESLGWGWLETLHPEDREVARACWNRAVEKGGFEVEYRICGRVERGYRWFQTRATPVRDESGHIVEWLGTSTDIHDLRELQERQKVLVAELQHRTRNLMGVVRAMSDKTLRSSATLQDFRDRFRDRLDALARIQGLLSRLNEHDRVSFDELIRTELAAMEDTAEHVTLEGPSGVRLRSSTVQTLAMALHELATNAVKYGALGQPGGRLAIGWRLEDEGADGKPWLHIDWRESGVRMPEHGAAPRGTGQGRELIEHALPYQLRAKTSYTLGADGVHCTISIPVSASTIEVESHA